MTISLSQNRSSLSYRVFSAFLIVSFLWTCVLPPGAAFAKGNTFLNLPAPGMMVRTSKAFVPVLLKGMTIHADDPFRFDFIIDSGNTNLKAEELKAESERLVKYFLASMTIPKDDLWVNLSPLEKDRIVPDELGKTELGRDMLAQDYLLKQLTASLMYPEDELGDKFWQRVRKLAQERFGTTEIPVNTFNKVWILPESASVYEHEQTVYVVGGRLKVMLDEDYKTMSQGHQVTKSPGEETDIPPAQGENNQDIPLSLRERDGVRGSVNSVSSQIIREVILPEIEREVNEGEHFAPLRQIYHSLILAKWYKETIKDSLLSQVYVDQSKVEGVNLADETAKEQIYEQYVEAYKKGVFNYIKEDYDQLSQKKIPRKYFSGGIKGDVTIEREKSSSSIKSILGKAFIMGVMLSLLGAGQVDVVAAESKKYDISDYARDKGRDRRSLYVYDYRRMTYDEALRNLRDSADGFRVDYGSAEMMGKYGPRAAPAVPSLIVQVKRGNGQAIDALVQIGKPAVPSLMKWMQKGDRHFLIVASILGRIGHDAKDAVPDLIRLLDNLLNKEDSNTYRPTLNESAVVYVLGKIGPGAKAAIPVLKKVMERNSNVEDDFLWRQTSQAIRDVGFEGEIPQRKRMTEIDAKRKQDEFRIKEVLSEEDDGLGFWKRREIKKKIEEMDEKGEIFKNEKIKKLFESLKDDDTWRTAKRRILEENAVVVAPLLVEELMSQWYQTRSIDNIDPKIDPIYTLRLEEVLREKQLNSVANIYIKHMSKDVVDEEQLGKDLFGLVVTTIFGPSGTPARGWKIPLLRSGRAYVALASFYRHARYKQENYDPNLSRIKEAEKEIKDSHKRFSPNDFPDRVQMVRNLLFRPDGRHYVNYFGSPDNLAEAQQLAVIIISLGERKDQKAKDDLLEIKQIIEGWLADINRTAENYQTLFRVKEELLRLINEGLEGKQSSNIQGDIKFGGIDMNDNEGDHSSSPVIKDLAGVEQLIQSRGVEGLMGYYDSRQDDKFHTEGPTLKHHLQAMLNGLEEIDIATNILPPEYIKLMREERAFFEWFILLHDLGKPATRAKNAQGDVSYPGHAAEAVKMMDNLGLATDYSRRETLRKIVGLHMELFDREGIREEIKNDLKGFLDKNGLTAEEIKLLVCSVFLDLYFPTGKYFDKDMERVRTAVRFLEGSRNEPGSSPALEEDVGGIDMNEIPVDRQGSGVDVQFDLEALPPDLNAQIKGFAPVIINIVPLPSILPLLGLEDEEEEVEEALQLSSAG